MGVGACGNVGLLRRQPPPPLYHAANTLLLGVISAEPAGSLSVSV